MMDEFGIFNDEGLVEGQFASEQEAWTTIESNYPNFKEDQLEVCRCCHDHPEQPALSCEECNSEEEEEE